MPYWLTEMLAATPAALWIYAGLGLPWALALLPRRDWRSLPLLLCLAFAAGPALLTAWMLLLGTLGAQTETALLRFDLITLGTVLLAGFGALLAWRKRHTDSGTAQATTPLHTDERLLLLLIAAALLLRWLATAYWPFTAYDALWVYGYQGRLYFLRGVIPNSIDYYPQFLPLQYTYLQLAVGAINDHAARAVLPLLHLGSVLAAYVLGARLFTRRTGIFLAALWALYPHVGDWARFGDLEIPLTFLFTATAALFLLAWTSSTPFERRRYALLAGLLFGVAMWTKPTAGAFIWGVALLVAVEFVRLRAYQHGSLSRWREKFEVALLTGLACIPLGAVWYLRNLALGHNAIDFPPAFWLTQASRNGGNFGWLLVALALLLALTLARRREAMHGLWRGAAGLLLLLAGLLPSLLGGGRMGLAELAGLLGGAGLLLWQVWQQWREHLSPQARAHAGKVALALLLAAPYFVTYFYSYSYHFRLLFPVVPLLLLPTAALLAAWLNPAWVAAWTRLRRALVLLLVAALAVPGVLSTLYDVNGGWDWLWSGTMTSDFEKYQSGNRALLWIVEGLQNRLADDPRPFVVVAPGVLRLPFFFPGQDIRTEVTPTTLAEMQGVPYFVYGVPESSGAYEPIAPLDNQLLAALGRAQFAEYYPQIVSRPLYWDDGVFNYALYELDTAARFSDPGIEPRPAGEVVFGDFARFVAHTTAGVEYWQGRRIIASWTFEVLQRPQQDYVLFIHLLDADGTLWAAWDNPLGLAENGVYYSSLLWEPGEFIQEWRWLQLQNPDTPPGDDYRIDIGFYDLAAQQRVPVTVDGAAAGDSYSVNVIPVQVLPPP